MSQDTSYPRRVVLNGVRLESGEPKDIGGPTPIRSDDKWGRAPSRWTLPVLLVAVEEEGDVTIANAEIVYETVFLLLIPQKRLVNNQTYLYLLHH